jgi:hypothetical protein
MQHNLYATSYQETPRDMVRDAISFVESSLPGFWNTTLLTCFHAAECVPMRLAYFVTLITLSLSHSQSRRLALKDNLSWPGAFLIDCEKRLHCPTGLVRCLRAVPAVGSTFRHLPAFQPVAFPTSFQSSRYWHVQKLESWRRYSHVRATAPQYHQHLSSFRCPNSIQ